LKDIVIVDNSIISFFNNISNGIYVPSYIGQRNDDNLLQVINLLKKVANCDNIQEELNQTLELKKLFSEFIEMENNVKS